MQVLLCRALISFALFFSMASWISPKAQITIDFDNPDNWISSEMGIISGYQTDHHYVDGVFSATGGEATRQTSSEQDGYAGALGNYAWRLRDRSSVEWTMTIASGGVGEFSLDIRRWDDDPSPAFDLEYSAKKGSDWTLVQHIDNDALDNSSDWKTFNGTINSSNDSILIRLKATMGTERIMVDNFVWYDFSSQATATVDEHVNGLSIWPNPVSDVLNIDVKKPLAHVEFLNITGQTTKTIMLDEDFNVDIPVSDLPTGFYFLRLVYISGDTHVKKVMVK